MANATAPADTDRGRERSTAALVRSARQHAVGDIVRRTAHRLPDKAALVGGDLRWTYRELNDTVNRTAHALAERGVTKGDRIGLLSHNCWQFVVARFALAKLGAILVPVNFMLGAGETAYILRHAGVSGMICEDALGTVADEALAEAGVPGGIRGWVALAGADPAPGWEPFNDWTTHQDHTEPDVSVGDDDPLQLMYTSGTEARPKGVMLSSRSLITQYVSCIVDGGMAADDVEAHALPLYHCAQLDCFLTPDLYLGATSVILPGPEPAALLRTIEAERVTKLFAPPTVWIALLRSPAFDATDLASLRKGY